MKTDRPVHEGVEIELAALAERSGGLERLVEIAWSAGRHGEICYGEWLDNTLRSAYRNRRAEYDKRNAQKRERTTNTERAV